MNASVLLFIVVLFGAVYVFLILPQRRARRVQQEMITKLSPGAEVITTGGLYGTVTEIEDGETVLLEVAEDTEVRFAKSAIARVVTAPEPAPDASDTDADAADASDTDAGADRG